jgi:putative inorganic carbon (HCO3(-)) transporter
VPRGSFSSEGRSRSPWHAAGPPARIEAIVVLLVSPALLFPTAVSFLTLLALIALATVWLLPLVLERRPGLPATPFNLALIPWGIMLMVAMLVSADIDQTLPKAAGLILGLAVWRVLVLLIRTRRDVPWAVAGFVALGLGLVFIGALGIDASLKVPGLTQFNLGRALSLSGRLGLTIHPNQLAGLICLFLPLLISLLVGRGAVGRRHTLTRVGLLIATVFVVVVLLSTQSRGGWVGTSAGLLALLAAWSLRVPPSPARTVARAATVAVLLAGLAGLLWIGPARLQALWLAPPTDTALGTFTTLLYRQELWPWALKAAGDFAYTGTGLGSFREVAFRLYPVQISPSADIGHAHNIFLQTALDVGVPGLVTYGSLLIIAVGGAWSAAREVRLRPVALGLLAGLVGLHVYGLADALSLGSKPGILFWYALGLIAALCTVARRPLVQPD